MSEKEIVVVACEGYDVLLNVGADCLSIDAFTPVNLSELYDETTLRNCKSLQTHLRDGHLVEYEGQKLPKDPDSRKVSALRQSSAKHIKAQYKQAACDEAHPTMGIKTSAVNVNADSEKSLQQQVAMSRKQLEAQAEQHSKNVQEDFSDTPGEKDSLDPKATAADDVRPRNLKVAMDVSEEEFVARQRASRKKLEDEQQAAEVHVKEEMEQFSADEDNDVSEGRQ